MIISIRKLKNFFLTHYFFYLFNQINIYYQTTLLKKKSKIVYFSKQSSKKNANRMTKMEVIRKRSEVILPSFIGHLRSFVLHPPRSSFSFLSEYLAITYRDVNANNYSLSLRASWDNIVIYKTAFQEERSCLSLADLTRLESPRSNLKTLMDARISTRWRSNYSVISYKCAVSVFLTRSRWINIALNQFMCSWPNI